jgi:hypothetical protein
MPDLKVIQFPKPRRPSVEMDTDERNAAAVFTAHRALLRKIDAARRSGLTVEYDGGKPKITKQYGPRTR